MDIYYYLVTPSAPFSQTKLLTAGSSPLPWFGAPSIPQCFGSRPFSWSFQLAPFSVPILGSNFLCHHALLVDVARARVLDADSLDVLSAVSSPAASDPFCAHLQQAPREIQKLLSKYPDVLSSRQFFSLYTLTWSASEPSQRSWSSSFPRSLPFGSWENSLSSGRVSQDKDGQYCVTFFLFVVQPSSHGSWTWWYLETQCSFLHLNTATVPDRYPLPTIADFSARIAGSKFFSKLDL